MTTNLLRKSTMTALAVAVLSTSGVFAASGTANAALGIASPNNSTVQEQTAEGAKVAHRRHRHGRRHRHHWGHWRYDDCFWKRKRYWDGDGYYYRNIRICY